VSYWYVIADVHVDARARIHGREPIAEGGGNLLYQRIMKTLDWVCSLVDTQSRLLILGDLFTRHNPSPEELCGVVELFWERYNGKPVIVIPGNHELPRHGRGPIDLLNVATGGRVAPGVGRIELDGLNVYCRQYMRTSVGADELAWDLKELAAGGDVLLFHGALEGGFVAPDEAPLPKDAPAKFRLTLGGHEHRPDNIYCGCLVPRTHGEESFVPEVLRYNTETLKRDSIPVPHSLQDGIRLQTVAVRGDMTRGDIRGIFEHAEDFVRVIVEEEPASDALQELEAIARKRGKVKVEYRVATKDVREQMGGGLVDAASMTDLELVKAVAQERGELGENDDDWLASLLGIITSEFPGA